MATFVPAYRPDAILLGREEFTVDPSNGVLAVSAKTKYDEKTASKVVALFIEKLSGMRASLESMPQAEKLRVIQAADLCLKTLTEKHRQALDKGLPECRSNKFLMSLAKLDRYVAAHKFQSLTSQTAIPAGKLQILYRTQVARDLLTKWISEPTHTGRKTGGKELDHKVVNSEKAAEAYFLRPEEVDFLSESFTHKQMGRLGEHIEIDPETRHHRIRFQGTVQNVDAIAERLRIGDMGKLFSKEDGKRYFYCQDEGIREYDPENWKELPIFRARKHARSEEDYRLVIKTIVNDKDGDKHSWIELKTPTAVYNVGYFWDDADSDALFTMRRFITVRGKLHAVDKNELIGKQQFIQKTVSSISKEQFEMLKKSIEDFQNKPQPKMFNLINSNCSAWTARIASTVGLTVSSKENGTRYVTGKRFEFKHKQTTLIGKVERAWHKVLAVLRNILIYTLGGSRSALARSQFDVADLPFRSFKEVFDVDKAVYDFPHRIRDWQDAVAAHRKDQEEQVRKTSAFESLDEAERQKLLDKVRYALPVGVSLPNPAVTF